MNAHKVEAETVNVILCHPILDTLNHIGLHHWVVGSCFIATTRTISQTSICLLAEEITRGSQFEIRGSSIHYVIIDYIHDDTNTSLVASHHHLLELVDSDGGVVRIGAIASIRNIVIQWVVTPVVFMLFECGLIDRSIIITWHNVYMRHSKFLQVIDTRNSCIFRQRKIFTQILQST